VGRILRGIATRHPQSLTFCNNVFKYAIVELRRPRRSADGFTIDEATLVGSVPGLASGKVRDDTALVFSHLYTPEDFVCVNTDFHLDKGEKPIIAGPRTTYRARQWLRTACSTAERNRLGCCSRWLTYTALKESSGRNEPHGASRGLSRLYWPLGAGGDRGVHPLDDHESYPEYHDDRTPRR
jgi:hypothetical protein